MRLLVNGIISFLSFPSINNAKNQIKSIVKSSDIVASWKKGNSTLAEAAVTNTSVTEKPKENWKDLDKEDLESLISSVHNYIKSNIPNDVVLEIDLRHINWSELFCNSEESRVYQEYPYTILTVTASSEKNGQRVRYYQNFGGLGGLEVVPFRNFTQFDKLIDIAQNFKNSKMVKAGNYKTVMSEDITWTLIHEVLGHSLEADNVLAGKSFTAGLLGMKIAPPIISVIDDPYIHTVGYYEFDSEGVKGKGTLLLEEGILTDFLHSRKTAAAMGGLSTGNYKAHLFDSLPQVRMSNIFIEPRDYTDEELIEDVKNGIFIGDGLSGSSEPQTGYYNLNAQYGREIRDGELGDYLYGFQIGGQMMKTLSNISGIGKKIYTQPASCVKNHQRIYLGSISPKISISDIRVS